jgi:hypothetical protein
LPTDEQVKRIWSALADVNEYLIEPVLDSLRLVIYDQVPVTFEEVGKLGVKLRQVREMIGYVSRDLSLIEQAVEYLGDELEYDDPGAGGVPHGLWLSDESRAAFTKREEVGDAS